MAEKLSKEDIELFNFIINDPESGEAEKKIAREVLEKDNSLKEKPKSTKATPKKKSVSKKTSKPKMSDIEKKKMEILKKTGKTEEECKKIIEQYRALKSEAVTKRKKDTKRKIVAKKRTAKLKKEGKTIQGTTEKNVEATLDTTSKKVVKKIDKEIDKIEKTSKTEKQVEKKISSLVTQAVRSNKKLLSDTAKELAKVDKNNAKQYLLSLKKEIETLLSKYAYGGSVERRGHGGMMHSQGYNDRLDESLGNRNRVEPLMMQSFKDRRDESKGMEKSMGRSPYSSVGTMDKMAKGGRIKVGDAVISMKDNFPKTIGMGKRETGIVQDLIKGDDGDVAVVDASNGRIVYAKAKNLETLDTLIRDLEKGGMMKSQGYNDKLDDSLGSSNGKRSKKQQNYKDRRDESEAMAKKGGRRKYSRVKTMDKGNRKKRKTPMTLAKEIRKEGEKWQDAVKRASAMLKNK